MSSSTNLHTAWARLFVRALAETGVRDMVVSPGSRSTPLALAASHERSLRCHVHVDERVAGFFALGQARATGRPSVLVCTSGTAGAHWIPAAIEASLTGVPMVCVTADRPWEAYDCASPQTVDQSDLLGRHARYRAELGAPDPAPSALRAVARVAAQCVHRACWPLAGAVHLNARFRKPLEPVDVDAAEAWEPLVAELMARGPTRSFPPRHSPSPEAVTLVAEALRGARRPWIVCGPSLTHDPALLADEHAAIEALCRSTGASLLAEATSGMRFGRASVPALPSFDALLRSASFRDRAWPDLVVELGLPPTSSAYGTWIGDDAKLTRYVVAPQGWPDPHGTAAAVVLAEPGDFARELTTALAGHHALSDSASIEAQRIAWEAITAARDDGSFHEGTIPAALVDALPSGAVLCVGNSLPARDIDTFTEHTAKSIRVLHQRGASGIDGLIAGAAGVRSVTDRARPVAVYLGDLSALHDLGGMNAARIAGGPLAIVIVNNDGGRIFEQLPLGRRAARGGELGDRFEAMFTTPQSRGYEHAAAMFDLGYRRVCDRESLAEALRHAVSSERPIVIEAVVDPTSGRTLRDRMHEAVRAAIDAQWRP